MNYLIEGINNIENGTETNFFSTILNQDRNYIYKPPIDLVETDTHIKINMDIPGVKKNTIDVNFFNNKIEVTGEREKPYSEESSKCEIFYGKFNRKITLPISVTNKNSVKINCNNGVLEIEINKSYEEKNKFTLRLNE
jgi:HSP20 family protein